MVGSAVGDGSVGSVGWSAGPDWVGVGVAVGVGVGVGVDVPWSGAFVGTAGGAIVGVPTADPVAGTAPEALPAGSCVDVATAEAALGEVSDTTGEGALRAPVAPPRVFFVPAAGGGAGQERAMGVVSPAMTAPRLSASSVSVT